MSQSNNVMQIWEEHFAQLLNQRTPIDWPTINSLAQAPPKLSMNVKPIMEELQEAIKQLCNCKSPGADGLPAELFKSGGPILHHALLNLMHKIWSEEYTPGDFKSSSVIPVYEGGDNLLVDRY